MPLARKKAWLGIQATPPDFAVVAFANFSFYDLVGRSYRAGMRLSF